MKKIDAMKRSTLDPKLLTVYDVQRLIGKSRGWIYKHMKENNFPKPVRFGRSVMWKRGEIENWIDGLEA